jgi:hypothetical protein
MGFAIGPARLGGPMALPILQIRLLESLAYCV